MAAFVSLGLLQLCNKNKAQQSRNAKGVQHQARAGTKKVGERFVGGCPGMEIDFQKNQISNYLICSRVVLPKVGR
jgi:hypothetical protein